MPTNEHFQEWKYAQQQKQQRYLREAEVEDDDKTNGETEYHHNILNL